jgi:hypothetical protein
MHRHLCSHSCTILHKLTPSKMLSAICNTNQAHSVCTHSTAIYVILCAAPSSTPHLNTSHYRLAKLTHFSTAMGVIKIGIGTAPVWDRQTDRQLQQDLAYHVEWMDGFLLIRVIHDVISGVFSWVHLNFAKHIGLKAWHLSNGKQRISIYANSQQRTMTNVRYPKECNRPHSVVQRTAVRGTHGLSGVPRGGFKPPSPEIPKFWQSWAEFPVPWKIHP